RDRRQNGAGNRHGRTATLGIVRRLRSICGGIGKNERIVGQPMSHTVGWLFVGSTNPFYARQTPSREAQSMFDFRLKPRTLPLSYSRFRSRAALTLGKSEAPPSKADMGQTEVPPRLWRA